jgi:hypothetical protein
MHHHHRFRRAWACYARADSSVYAALLSAALRLSLAALIVSGLAAPTHHHTAFAQSQRRAACDTDTRCTGNALTQSVHTGSGAQFVDVRRTASQTTLTTALTVEMWIRPERQAGTRQFLAGLWGPNTDVNDVWMLAISAQDELLFEVNHPQTALGATDNTTVRTPAAMLYGAWNHVAASFDGTTQTARLFVNGVEVASARNAQSPAMRLRTPQNSQLLLQIGSTNALDNAGEQNRTFRGQMDEIRLWSRALTAQELLCQKDESLTGGERNLVLYYRCNEAPNAFTLCDATGNGNTGDLRSGARCEPSSRQQPQWFALDQVRLDDALQCIATKTYTLRLRNTSVCTKQVTVSLAGQDASEFSVSPASVRLNGGEQTTLTVRLQTQRVGALQATLQITPQNACDTTLTVPITVQRTSSLATSRSVAQFDTLLAGCRQTTFRDDTLRLTNLTAAPLVVFTAAMTQPQSRFQLVGSTAPFTTPLMTPFTLPREGQQTLRVRFAARPSDTSGVFFDTLRLTTADPCQPVLNVPLVAVLAEGLVLRRGYGLARLDSVRFPATCPTQITEPVEFTWENPMTTASVRIDTVRYPRWMLGRRVRYPIALQANTFPPPNFLRFQPLAPGEVRDSVVVVATVTSGINAGCTIERAVHVSGRGTAFEVSFAPAALAFGNVTVGQERLLTATVTNPSPTDTLRVAAYVQVGEAITRDQSALTLLPGRSQQITVRFRPTGDSAYADQLCVFEQRCFTTACLPITGRGVRQSLRIDSALTRMDNVLGCGFALDTIAVSNMGSTAQTLSNFSFDAGGGRFALLSPNPLPALLTLQANATERFIVRYQPNDVQQDRSDQAMLRFSSTTSTTPPPQGAATPQSEQWMAQIRGTSIAPKLFITPLSAFGVVEVGDAKRDTIVLENISPIAVTLDSLLLPDGYRIEWLSRPVGSRLQPRDSVLVRVVFAPTQDRRYDGRVRAVSLMPCPTAVEGRLQGRGTLARLEVPISLVNFGFTRPCDCSERRIPLYNPSLTQLLTIQTLTIDSTNVPGGLPTLFSWRSRFAPNGRTPFQIPPNTSDTLTVRYCPRTPAEERFGTSQARLFLVAQGTGWSAEYEVFLAGRRTLTMLPTPPRIDFMPTRVDTSSAPRLLSVAIPSVVLNPTPAPIRIDSLRFEPDEGVFSVQPPAGRSFPLTLLPNEQALGLQVRFRPREARLYTARVVMRLSQPCADVDTTVLVTGIGFTSALGVQFRFSSLSSTTTLITAAALDTIRLTTCGTVAVPIFSNRALAETLNVRMLLAFDTARVRLGGVQSLLSTAATLTPHPQGAVLTVPRVRLSATEPLATLTLVSRTSNRASLTMQMDSVNLSTIAGQPFTLIAAGSTARVLVQQPAITALNALAFDSVQILDCRTAVLRLQNTGDVPLTGFSMLALPRSMSIVGSVPPLSATIPPNGVLNLTLQYCPRAEERGVTIATLATTDTPATPANALSCGVSTSATVRFMGFAPPFPVAFSVLPPVTTVASLRARLGDTVNIPIHIHRDLSTRFRDTTFWLRGVSFETRLGFSPYALQFLGAEAAPQLAGNLTGIQPSATSVRLRFTNVDSLRAGVLARLRFLVLAPDTVSSALVVETTAVRVDSLPFLRVLPEARSTPFWSDSAFGISTLLFPRVSRFSHVSTRSTVLLLHNAPNPFHASTMLRFVVQAEPSASLAAPSATPTHATHVTLSARLYSPLGVPLATLLEPTAYTSGLHSVNVATAGLASGVYYCVWETVYEQHGKTVRERFVQTLVRE